MEEKECIFCSIIKGVIPAKIVYEDEHATAFLDKFPRSRGMTIVAPKQHYIEFDENFEISQKVFSSALTAAEMIKQTLEPKSISMSIMPSEEVPHFHIRLYPTYEEEQTPLIENRPIETSEADLELIAQKIRGIKIEVKKEEVKEEKVEEKKEEPRSKEDIYWLKRSMEIR